MSTSTPHPPSVAETTATRNLIFVGVSTADPKASPPTEPTFREAAENAYGQLPPGTTGYLRLIESKHNAISEYIVIFKLEQ